MMNGGHWDLQHRPLALLEASDAALKGGGAGVGGVFEKWCLKLASDVGGNGTVGLVINMGHGEGRDQAGSVDEVRKMPPRERSYLARSRPKYPCFCKNKVSLSIEEFGLAPGSPGELGGWRG